MQVPCEYVGIMAESGIANKNELIRNGSSPLSRSGRKIVLEVLEKCLKVADPEKLILSRLRLKGDILILNGMRINLRRFERVYVVGAGKASGEMALALEKLLGERITKGLVCVPRPMVDRYNTSVVELAPSDHPIPSQDGVRASRRIARLLQDAGEGDLVLCTLSGGASSLMPIPAAGIELKEKAWLIHILVRRGAAIDEVNTVRKHLSQIKGGWLAKRAFPARLVSLILSDVVGDPVDVIGSGPTAPDPTTYGDAVKILKKYDLWAEAPSAIKERFKAGLLGRIRETPKPGEPFFNNVSNVIIGNTQLLCMAAMRSLRRRRIKSILLSTTLQGEARQVGRRMASFTLEVKKRVPTRSRAIVAGGETTVTVTGRGIGGRNQELALAFCVNASRAKGIVAAALATDGVDGPTNVAGAIGDSDTIKRGIVLGLDANRALRENDSYTYFSALGDLIITGPTGTNLNDLVLVLVLPE